MDSLPQHVCRLSLQPRNCNLKKRQFHSNPPRSFKRKIGLRKWVFCKDNWLSFKRHSNSPYVQPCLLMPVVLGLSRWGAALSPQSGQAPWLDQLRGSSRGILRGLQTLKPPLDSQGNFAYRSSQPSLPLTQRANSLLPLHQLLQGFETIEQNQHQSRCYRVCSWRKGFPSGRFCL